ncbi:MAG: hypothetical protein ACYC65_03005, partial [Candidatus Limnocylindrales bacterium]
MRAASRLAMLRADPVPGLLQPIPGLPQGVEEAEAKVPMVTRRSATIAAVFGRVAVRAALAALILAASTILPALATSGPTSLFAPAATPTSGMSGTSVTFTVTYRNSEGSPPDYVRVVVAGATHAMTPTTTSETWRKGVRFEVSLTLPVGSWDPVFEAADREKFTASVAGPTVMITPAPTP